MDYSRFLTRSFQYFSIRSAIRTAVPTALHYLSPRVLPPSPKPALFTMNILPPMLAVWHHVARKALGDAVDIVIFDCSGTLDPADFPGCLVQKFLNPRHAQKCDRFLHVVSRHRKIAWVCDDDTFLLTRESLDIVERELAVPGTASVSFEPRIWWHLEIGGKRYEPSGTYCLALNRAIVAEQEKLSFAPADGNAHPTHIPGRPVGRYDSFDKANEILLEKGYRCAIVPEADRKRCTAGFDGVSNGVMILSAFRTPEQTMDYLRGPPLKQWSGNILFRVLNALLCISVIDELYTALHGRPYPLPSLPPRVELEKLRREVEPYLRSDVSFSWMDEAAAKLRSAL